MKRLRDLLHAESITQAELAEGIGKTEAHVSKLVLGHSDPSQQTMLDILDWLCARLGRKVTFEELRDTNPSTECK